jgi:hypothetical protein
MRAAHFALLGIILLAACGGGGGGPSHDDGRAMAIQTMLNAPPFANGSDRRPSAHDVINGHVCRTSLNNPASYAHVPGVVLTTSGSERGLNGSMLKCWIVKWNPATGIHQETAIFGMTDWAVPIGTWIVDKVGDEQTEPLGKITPYKAHVDLNALGNAMIAAHITTAPKSITDGLSSLHKDADGKWIAQ